MSAIFQQNARCQCCESTGTDELVTEQTGASKNKKTMAFHSMTSGS